MTEGEMQAIVDIAAKAAVHETLKSLGIDASNQFECQQDFAHLRKQRIASEQIGEWTRKHIWLWFLSGLLAIFLIGLSIVKH